jgi:hypothetical protein
MTEIRDFTKRRKAPVFRIDDDTFTAVAAIPAEEMISFAEQITTADPSQMSPREQVALLRKTLENMLEPESLARFQSRMGDRRNPIDMEQLNDVVEWLFEEYGLRPTTGSASSSNGVSPPVPGTTSTGSIPDVVSISALSPSTVS